MQRALGIWLLLCAAIGAGPAVAQPAGGSGAGEGAPAGEPRAAPAGANELAGALPVEAPRAAGESEPPGAGAGDAPAAAPHPAPDRPGRPDPGDSAAYARELIARARRMRLAETEQWRRLGHWKRAGWSRLWFFGHLAGWESEADGEELFLAPDGKRAPAAELEATLRAFAQPAPDGPDGPDGDDHAICRFPARFLWLRRALDIDPARLPAPVCAGFQEFLDAVEPRAVVVVFSSYYLGQAASAFGHTFFRVEKQEPHAGAERRQLLDTGIDYSAHATTSNSLLYAIMGMTGGFRGSFRKMPYYYKVREYNDYESRDLWEYRLALDDHQLAMFAAHLWELGHTHFDYFYLTENCSYHILGALEVANPRWRLLDRLKTPVVPADTIKVLADTPGLVAEVSYRPSLMTQFRKRTRGMSDDQLALVKALGEDPDAPFPGHLSTRQRIEVLDAAADFIDIRWPEDVILRPESHAARTKQRLLARRAAIPAPSAALDIAPPRDKQPDRGHGTRRVAIGSGLARGGAPYLSLGFRATLHDLGDPSAGYPELSQIEFLPLDLRVSLDDARVWLERVSLVRIVHLNSFDRFNRRMSWKVNAGAVRLRDSGCADCLAPELAFGSGVAGSWLDERVTLYATVDNHLMWAPDLQGIRGAPLRFGIGPAGGLRLRLHERLIAHIDGEWLWLPVQEPFATWSVGGTLRWGITRDLALDLELRSRQEQLDGRISAMLYY